MDSVIDKAFAAALYAQGDDPHGLDTGASLLAAAPTADAELLRRGEEFLHRAWTRGWQPADLVRIVRRDCDDLHVRLVAELISTEARRYDSNHGSADQLTPRWRAQLEDIRRTPPWTAPDRFSRATALLALYRLLLRLPAIEPVGPPPGTPVTTPVPGEPRTLARIRALLAKAEATGYPEEAEALSAKAQELMARHSVDEALLAARTGSDGKDRQEPAAIRVGVDAPYETAKAILLDAVASANHCQAVWNEPLAFSTVIGFESDLEAVEILHASLLVQATAAMTRAEADQRASGRKRTKTFRQSFLLAYAQRIGARLATAAESATGSASASEDDTLRAALPVLAARDAAVTGRTERMFPETTTTRVRGATDAAGWTEGTVAADRARVSDGSKKPLP